MVITTPSGLLAAPKQRAVLQKTVARTSIAALPFSVIDLAGNPGAGTLAGTSVTAGVVPTDATAGFPVIDAFGGAATGYVTRFEFANTVASRLTVYDLLFKAGAYAFNAAQTLAAQPSYSTRVPGGTDFKGTEIWIEAVTVFTGNLSVAVTYTNQDGTAARTTGTIATGIAPTVGRMIRLPLQAGDTGVQKIETVTATVATVGTFNVLVLRQFAGGRVPIANGGDVYGPDRTGMPVVFADSALFLVVTPDSTSTGNPECIIEVANG